MFTHALDATAAAGNRINAGCPLTLSSVHRRSDPGSWEDHSKGQLKGSGFSPASVFTLVRIRDHLRPESRQYIASIRSWASWRVADRIGLPFFSVSELHESTPDHTTISRTRRLIDLETHRTVFGWVLKVLAEQGLLKGNTISIDGTTLEANAALRSIVHRETGEAYNDFLKKLAAESGIETPTREQLAKLDRKRPRKGSNEEWESPEDPDSRIVKMKDGRTHLAHKAEHAVDLETGAVVAVVLHSATAGDTQTVLKHLMRSRRKYLRRRGYAGFRSQR